MKKRTKKEKNVLYCYICQLNTCDEHDEEAGSNDYSINKRTEEQHSAEFCLSHKSSMKDTNKKEKERKKTMTINVYKDGHSQILCWGKKRMGDLCVCVNNEQKRRNLHT